VSRWWPFPSIVVEFLPYFLHSAARDKVKGCFILKVSVVNVTPCHGKHVACHVACELQAGCACIKIHMA